MIEDYNFEANGDFEEHLEERHFNESVVGSVFFREVFKTPRELIKYALEKIRNEYRGELLELNIETPSYIGLDAVVSLENLPKDVEIEKELRGDVFVNVAYGAKRRPTKKIVIIAGPLDDLGKPGKHGFRSIYPGKYCPDFKDEEFWSKHAFAKERR